MKDHKLHTKRTIVTSKDIIIIMMIVAPFTFIDLRTALFVGAISASLIFIRGVVSYLKPRQINGHVALGAENVLFVPKGVEVFELAGDAPMDTLYKHIAVLRAMGIHPKILIIRFRKISLIQSNEAHVLIKIVRMLSERKTLTFFSEMNEGVKDQFEKLIPGLKTSGCSIFYKIDDALKRAETLLNVQ